MGPEQEGRLADPIGERRAVEVHALAGINLHLAIQGKTVGIFADQHMGDGRFGWDAALDESWWSRCLHHDLFTGPAGVFRPARDEHAELGRHDVEALGNVLAHDVQHSLAARADLVGDIDDLLDTLQVRRQCAAVGAALPGASLTLGRIVAVLCRGSVLGIR